MTSGEKIARSLSKKGLSVHKLSEWHFRVNGQFDFFLNAKGRPVAYHDIATDERGRIPEDQIVFFVPRRLSETSEDVPEQTFVSRLVAIGWSEHDAKKEWEERTCSEGK